VNIVPQGLEKYLSISWGKHIVFKDSCQFLNASLATLFDNLKQSGAEKFQYLAAEFPADKVAHMLRKGVYPYDWMDGWAKFDEVSLPPIAQFKSSLTGEECSVEDYAHAHLVFREFGCATVRDYHDLYLKSDVLQLTDVFEHFRETCMKHYELDPAHYLSAPGYSWDAMLKFSKVQLDLMTDASMFNFLERGMRGGICMISKRYAKANNKYMQSYNPAEPSRYIIYLDANNLYGWAMTKPLPHDSFQWVDDDIVKSWDEDYIMSIPENREFGYIFEVDLDYPAEFHDEDNDYPLAPERLVVKLEMISDKQLSIKRSYKTSDADSVKLVPNLMHKRNYVVHYRLLQFYLEKGMELKKIHRVIKFKQTCWLKRYIQKNSKRRAKAKTAFEKDFFKLLNNAIYGKTCENLRKRMDIKIVTTDVRLKKLTAKPNCLSIKIFGENCAAVNMNKLTLLINKPSYAGFCVLELSKLLMYQFHYNIIKPKYGDKAQLLFTDTDSLMYEIETDDVYKDFFEMKYVYLHSFI